MARMLSRSRSMKMLKGSAKEIGQRDVGNVTPLPSNIHAGIEQLNPTTYATTTDMRADTPEPRQRPRTSSGPADRSKLFHKKVAPVTLSPGEHDLLPISSHSTTVLYTAEVHEDGIIGMALGSPTMASPWNTAPHGTDFVTTRHQGPITHISSDNSSRNTTEGKQGAPKPKISRWKSIFGRKHQAPSQQQTSFYQAQQSVYPPQVDSHHEEERLDSRAISRSASRVVSPAPFKPEHQASQKKSGSHTPSSGGQLRAETNVKISSGRHQTTLTNPETSPKPPSKDNWNASPMVPKVVVSNGSRDVSPRTMGGTPLLDVDIPRIEMERYSVMFGSLLQPNGTSSLLARRQGNPERLKPLNELSMKPQREEDVSRMKPRRRATSPSIPNSPSSSLSLFPQPDKPRESLLPSPRMTHVHRPRPLQRSRTAPPASPNRQSFAKELDDSAKELSQSPKRAADEETGLETPGVPPTLSSRHSFESGSDGVTILVAKAPSPFQRRMKEPEWEIISKPLVRSVSQNQTAVVPLNVRADIKTRSQNDQTPKSADLTPQKDNQSTVGVARTVSVSRAAGLTRRQMLKPMNPKALGTSEKLVERRAMTPTLVELENRKSQRVQIVDA
ncbi:hypothetical protein GQ43DRAFT_363429 [Delitschia confertaspora ATCC 74209]|uniref:Uncharacterized protein n=1 Tax=Delitschia confertaspora ATCC 74209 TaxID=1513339 RepID=A0A9P4JSY6_9PLEO|nr:hypothetical protein GQ43DRAFT_363429 [Delitschia confertaspora ATCC 74209]